MSIAIESLPSAAKANALAATNSAQPNLPVPAVDAVICVLRELRHFVASIADEQYTRNPVGPMKSSIGGHVRHCLDHVAAVLVAARTGRLDYDARERGTAVEHNRCAALQLMQEQELALCELRRRFTDRRLRLSALLSPHFPPLRTTTTLSRELAFTLSHTVHHNSLLAVAAGLMGVSVPERFGYAPATLAWMNERPCAR